MEHDKRHIHDNADDNSSYSSAVSSKQTEDSSFWETSSQASYRSSRTMDSNISHSLQSLQSETESNFGDDNDEGYVEVDLPEYACTYCGLSDQACVVKCVESG